MGFELLGLVLVLLLWVAWAIVTERRHRRLEEQGRLPPGPTPWPVVGNIFQLGWAPHESFAKLAHKHGPIMTLWLGSMCTVVVSSSEAAREMFKNHDMVLAGRKIYEAMKGDYGNEGSLITAQYGPHWRLLRRLSNTEFFVTNRLDAMAAVRSRCIDQMVQFMAEAGKSGTTAIDVGRFFFLMAFNLIGNLMFSKDLLDPNSKKGKKFFYHAGKVMELAGKPNMADFLPMLRWLDPQGIRKKMKFHVNEAFDIAGGFIKERMENMDSDYGDYGNEGSLITAQYGPHWRLLRRLSNTEFFVTNRLDAMAAVRSRCIDQMVQFMAEAGKSGTTAIDVGRFFFLMAFNLIGNLMFSKDLLDPNSKKGKKFFYHAGKVMELAGKPNMADFLPMLRWLDPQGIRKKMKFHVNEAFDIAGGFIKERMENMDSDYGEGKKKDYLDVLLEYRGDGVEGPQKFSTRTINNIVFKEDITITMCQKNNMPYEDE
ncbi:unnamed protein product [Ilex paraguariensis]|uniref:Cytochrome P450 n=1 Tax=Ilex paraguariensis TaxID=185542 RepID=A0ABC8T811_9AQUA